MLPVNPERWVVGGVSKPQHVARDTGDEFFHIPASGFRIPVI